MMATWRTVLVPFGLLLLAPLPAPAQHLPMWQIDGASNRVFLLGSIHMLRESDHPIPPGIYDAYEEAEVLVMELDMDDTDPVADQALVSELGLIADGRELRDLMGPELYDEAEVLAESLRIPLSMLARSEPWFAAITVEVMMLMRAGFDPAHGVEAALSAIAARDAKEIRGLETTRQQLEILDGLSLAAQRQLLLQTLAESGNVDGLMDDLVAAWRRGDMDYLEQNLLEDMEDSAELHRVIVVERNHNWIAQIEDLLDDADDYLVVVGALHLVGEDGVPELLARAGHDVRQVEAPAAE